MTVALKIIDEAPGRHAPIARQLQLASERMTLREVLKRRIEEEVAAINAADPTIRPLVVAPSEEETRLNGERVTRPLPVDAARQLAAATEAFERTRILVVVDGRQMLDLDEPITITPGTEVRFIKLVPLVGG
ncbi:hypothetical protein SSBR45G_72350 [Bradyrhizobium sp. SSBR45G]|uniref:hypothetical protein n=1 Tax=unclassified Bradyrhizobium TaxID=2631580 RepID=UPI0023429BD5|nr:MULTISPECIES: hypothetical protein [unclassified Bradyrhizobium]GLH82326.1 hypothetical protein SSBR45G_72350 [Bradyrhizobium sp. SSBR45G]GLH89773.1 hypothetical protein SSBR45R_72340 [Bradyrhizobium sp. SSBR45R]